MKPLQRKIASLTCAFMLLTHSYGQDFNGYSLYNEMGGNTVYLIDKDQNIAHSWSCDLACNYSVLLKDNGNIVRGGIDFNSQIFAAATAGIIQELDSNANVVWEFTYSDADHISHHDIALLPNGNVLLTAYEVKTVAELIQAGVDNPNSEYWPTHFIEVEQNGTGGQIVWEWHIWDHMIQDVDSTKDNFGVVSDHPELMDINAYEPFGFGFPGFTDGDWFHVNGVDYNEALDQIVFSSRYTSEIYIIDHSTTTAEAAGHTGGNSGMGGDFLYRWGNPGNYGSTDPQTIEAAVHDPRWIKDGRPNAGYIQFFNNEGGQGGNSVVQAINPPLSGYNYLMTGNSYAPLTADWSHDCLVSASGQSSHERMSNGNTFVNVSGEYMYEVNDVGNIVWQYNGGPGVGKAFRYECDHPGIIALLGDGSCSTASVKDIDNNISLFPNPTNGEFQIEGISALDSNVEIEVFDIQGNLILTMKNTSKIDLSEQSEGLYLVSMKADGKPVLMKKISVIK